MKLESSETMHNLMRAFAGESQARARYNMAAAKARSDGFFAVAKLFDLTAEQERAHGTVFYHHLKEVNYRIFDITASYPINVLDTTIEYVRAAQKNEAAEYETIYKSFAETARGEGFDNIANSFELVARIEQTHSTRFEKLTRDMSENTLYQKDSETLWTCTNCGHEFSGSGAPLVCPVCGRVRGYFLERSYFTIL